MNKDTFEGQWHALKGRVKERWGILTDSDIDQVEGRREQLLGNIQKAYGVARDEADRQVKDWESRL